MERQERPESSGRGFKNSCIHQHDGKNDHDDAGGPCDDVEPQRIHVVAHQVAAIDQKQNENKDYRQPHTIRYLRQDQDLPERRFRDQDDARAGDDQSGVKRIKRRSLLEFPVESRFKSEPFANHMRG